MAGKREMVRLVEQSVHVEAYTPGIEDKGMHARVDGWMDGIGGRMSASTIGRQPLPACTALYCCFVWERNEMYTGDIPKSNKTTRRSQGGLSKESHLWKSPVTLHWQFRER